MSKTQRILDKIRETDALTRKVCYLLLEAGLYAMLSDNGADYEWLAAPLRRAKLL